VIEELRTQLAQRGLPETDVCVRASSHLGGHKVSRPDPALRQRSAALGAAGIAHLFSLTTHASCMGHLNTDPSFAPQFAGILVVYPLADWYASLKATITCVCAVCAMCHQSHFYPTYKYSPF